MEPRKTFLLLIILFAAFQICFGQKSPQANQVDEFGQIICDDLSARIDNFYLLLKNNPQTKGHIIIYGTKNEPTEKYLFAERLKGFTKFLRADINRFVFRFGEAEKFKTQFWIVPNGEIFKFDGEVNYPELPEVFKPLAIHKNSYFPEGCPDSFDFKLYSDLLKANSKINANIVIYEKSLRKFNKVKQNILNELVKEYKTPANQIKTFFVKRYTSDVEFWLVPQKRR